MANANESRAVRNATVSYHRAEAERFWSAYEVEARAGHLAEAELARRRSLDADRVADELVRASA